MIKNFCLSKPKNAEFYADFKSVNKIQKMHQKSYKQNKFDKHELK